MTIIEMLGQSVILTVLGMGVVFAFLIVLVFVISFIGKLSSAEIPNPNVKVSGNPAPKILQETVMENNPQIVAAITAAVIEFQKSHNIQGKE